METSLNSVFPRLPHKREWAIIEAPVLILNVQVCYLVLAVPWRNPALLNCIPSFLPFIASVFLHGFSNRWFSVVAVIFVAMLFDVAVGSAGGNGGNVLSWLLKLR